jgi:hypothetical protein
MSYEMSEMIFNGHRIPWPGPYGTIAEYGRPPEDHDQGETGTGDTGE